MFQIGDKVAHPMHGAGVVESIVRKRVSGVTREYYIMKLPVRDMGVMIPTEGSGTIGVLCLHTPFLPHRRSREAESGGNYF